MTYMITVVNVRVGESDFISVFTNEYFKSQDVIYFKATASDNIFFIITSAGFAKFNVLTDLKKQHIQCTQHIMFIVRINCSF